MSVASRSAGYRSDSGHGIGYAIAKRRSCAPNTQAYVERFVQTLNHECWDHFVVCGLRHLAVITREFLKHYHTERPHQGTG